MKYHEFCTQFREKLLGEQQLGLREENLLFYPEGYRATGSKEEQEFIRDTNWRYYSQESDTLKGDFLVIQIGMEEEQGGMCRFSLLYLFEEFVASGWDAVWEIIRENLKLAAQSRTNEVIGQLRQYALIKDKLIIRPINFPKNKYLLKDHVFKLYGDIALTLYVIVSDSKQGLNTVKISRRLVEDWGKAEEEVWEHALKNTCRKAPPRMYLTPMECANPQYRQGAFMESDTDIINLRKAEVPTITTTRQLNGAIAMFYPGVLEKIGDLYGANYYVVFTSTDDVRVHHADSVSVKQIKEILQDVNRVFGEESMLSKEVFLYDREKRVLEPVTYEA